MEIVLGIALLTLSNANIQLDTESFIWRSYNAVETLLIARQIELIDKHKFAKAV